MTASLRTLAIALADRLDAAAIDATEVHDSQWPDLIAETTAGIPGWTGGTPAATPALVSTVAQLQASRHTHPDPFDIFPTYE